VDWEGIGLADEVLAWLKETGRRTATRERRLDPFATSMRDYDDVSANLRDIEDSISIQHSDAKQRVTDLRGAALVEGVSTAPTLTSFGKRVLDGWRAHNVANADKEDEITRTVIAYGAARSLGISPYTEFFAYWSELRATLDAERLIDNWDALFTLNYLDHRISNFAPGDAFRDEATPISEIKYDLDLFALSTGGDPVALKGSDQIKRGIKGKIPRGRARATACLAMEMLLRPAVDRASLITRFGLPRRPRDWQHLDADHTDRLLRAVASFDVASSILHAAPQSVRGSGPGIIPSKVLPALPEIDFAKVLKPIPKPRKSNRDKPKASPKKVDYTRRQERNGEVGRLGEEFALLYERWRLTARPDLAKQIQRVSLNDDTLGFDIQSFDPDGRERHVEVKTTEGPLGSRFFLSANEYSVAKAKSETYVLLRVGNVRAGPICCEVRPPFTELEMKAAVFEVTFRAEDSVGDSSSSVEGG
jgi:hypothetical protein